MAERNLAEIRRDQIVIITRKNKADTELAVVDGIVFRADFAGRKSLDEVRYLIGKETERFRRFHGYDVALPARGIGPVDIEEGSSRNPTSWTAIAAEVLQEQFGIGIEQLQPNEGGKRNV